MNKVTSATSCSVTKSHLTLQPHELQHTRLPCPSLSLWVCSNSCPLSQWYHPTISSSVTPFSFCLKSFPASGTFPMNQLFASDGQSIGASAPLLTLKFQVYFLWDWLVWSPCYSGDSRVFITTVWKHQFFGAKPSLCPALTSIHDYWKNHGFGYMHLCQQSVLRHK